VAIPIEVDGPDEGLPFELATAGPRRSGRRAPATAPAAELMAGGLVGRGAPPDHDLLVAERIAARARSVFGLRHTLVAPLTTDGGMIGALLVSRRTASEWPESAQRLLIGAAVESSAALSRVYSHRQAEARASTDALTGLPNRRYFDEFCALLARRRRAEDAVGVLMVDIDKFKGLNDRHGHQVGDEVLRAVAGAIVGAVREDDVPARYGGEEFAVLLRNPTRAVAVEVGERVRAAVGALDLRRMGVSTVSVSVGVAIADDPDAAIEDVIQQADQALYDAKRRGRDRVVAA
jgi:diguanylate cyclase (GGDEF)-like protein